MVLKKGHKINVGRKFSPQRNKKISETHKGKKLSINTRKKMSDSKKGKKHSEATKQKIKESVKINLPKTIFKKGMKKNLEERENMSKRMSGKNHPNYIDGRSKTLSPARYGEGWSKIRIEIYKRDNYECQKCSISMNECYKKHKVALHVHHKELFVETKNNSVSNLQTLCPSCHRKEDAKIFKQIREVNKINGI